MHMFFFSSKSLFFGRTIFLPGLQATARQAPGPLTTKCIICSRDEADQICGECQGCEKNKTKSSLQVHWRANALNRICIRAHVHANICVINIIKYICYEISVTSLPTRRVPSSPAERSSSSSLLRAIPFTLKYIHIRLGSNGQVRRIERHTVMTTHFQRTCPQWLLMRRMHACSFQSIYHIVPARVATFF